jgi:hypothetical protein
MKKITYYSEKSLSNKECVLSKASLVTMEMERLENGKVVFNNIIFHILRESDNLIVLMA